MIQNLFSSVSHIGSAYERAQATLIEETSRRLPKKLEERLVHVPRLSRHARDPMILTTTHWMRTGKHVALFVNPRDMQWSLPRRGVVVKTQAGAVRNVWRNRYRGTYYDEGTVGITFQTGNIMPSAAYPDDSELATTDAVSVALASPRVPPGLLNFYRFLNLLDQPMLMGAAENRHIIFHRSRVFPDLYMEGFFTEDSLSFSEVVTDGNRLEWQATFQIYRTVPRLYSSTNLEMTYTNFVRSRAQDEVVGQERLDHFYRKQPEDSPKKPCTVTSSSVKKQDIRTDTPDPFSGTVDAWASRGVGF